MTRKECLDKAAECVLQDRNREYGEPERSFHYIADLWSAYLRTKIEPYDAAAMMALFKLARLRFNPYYEDGWADLAGYAACGAELAGAEKAREDATRRWGAEYKKLRAEAEGNAKAEDCEEPEFKQGDAVELRDKARNKWMPCVYLRKAVDPGYSIVQSSDCGELLVSSFYLRKAEANHPEKPDSSPEFKRGDKVQFRDEIPSTSEPHWFDGTYVERLSTGGHAVKFGPHGHVIHCSDKEIRPAPKAEGCEELVQDEAEECRDCDGFQDGSIPEGCEGCMKTLEADAPQTPHDLYKRIIDANPATFKARTPTGEELAEMAEEEDGNG